MAGSAHLPKPIRPATLCVSTSPETCLNYYKRHLGDYARDTAHLTMLEHGAYGLLLDRYYATECGIPKVEAHRVCRARSATERRAVDTVLAEFFEQVGDFWVHGKCDAVIAEHREQAETNRRIAVKREATKRARSVDSSCNESLPEREPSHKPLASSHKPKRKKPPETPLPESFSISERVRAWAAERGHGRLPERLEAFVSYAKRKGATYCDWDEALMTAIREDWAKLGGPKIVQSATPIAFCTEPHCKSPGAQAWGGKCQVHYIQSKPARAA